ncbi:hypothetical protein OIV83_004600 [Microbotryomycetes sp. JL201]|nr:hypothetical protein OIV83_004600 [Microbotryomycetes sp. JL201]
MSEARTPDHIRRELDRARQRVNELEAELAQLSVSSAATGGVANGRSSASASDSHAADVHGDCEWPLSPREYQRYGRQMILSSVGLQGQLRLKNANILVVGVGGLGCPVLQYLVAAGVGHVTIIDHDDVELSNLHRQVLHNEHRVGMSKAESAKISLTSMNSDVRLDAHVIPFTPALFHSSDCPDLIRRAEFDVVLDCTDNPATRHFINAYAAAHQLPLVSGGAVRTEGTVGVFGLPLIGGEGAKADTGPCYACIFPASASNEGDETEESCLTQAEKELREDLRLERQTLQGTGACSDEGVLGVLCGVVGLQMAAETIRVLLGTAQPTLHLMSPISSSPLRTIKVRARKTDCPACGHFGTGLDLSTPWSRWLEFVSDEDCDWPGWRDPLCSVPGIGQSGIRNSDARNSGPHMQAELAKDSGVLLVDVRPPAEFSICHLPNSVNGDSRDEDVDVDLLTEYSTSDGESASSSGTSSRDSQESTQSRHGGLSDHEQRRQDPMRGTKKKKGRDKLMVFVGVGVLLLLIAVLIVAALLINSRSGSAKEEVDTSESTGTSPGEQFRLRPDHESGSRAEIGSGRDDDRSVHNSNVEGARQTRGTDSEPEPTTKPKPSGNDPPKDKSPSSRSESTLQPTKKPAEKPQDESHDAKPDSLNTPKGTMKAGKKGVGYNTADYTKQLDISWAYNWAPESDALSAGVEFVPMLWDAKADGWQDKAKQAIKNGATAVLGFNEPDLAEQADMSIAEAVAAWKREIEPLGEEYKNVKLISPAVTNGVGSPENPMGIEWLKQFFAACTGCRIDAVALHWYDQATNIAYFFKHLEEAHKALGKPLWVTEYMGLGSPEQQAEFLKAVVPWLEQQTFVERHAAFACFSDNPLANFIGKDGKANDLGRLYSSL